jgi:hypothetical protein
MRDNKLSGQPTRSLRPPSESRAKQRLSVAQSNRETAIRIGQEFRFRSEQTMTICLYRKLAIVTGTSSRWSVLGCRKWGFESECAPNEMDSSRSTTHVV